MTTFNLQALGIGLMVIGAVCFVIGLAVGR